MKEAAPGRLFQLLRFAGRVLMAPPWILRLLPPLAWGSLIFTLSSFRPRIDGVDFSMFGGLLTNMLHPGAFGILATLLVPAMTTRTRGWTDLTHERALWVVALTSIYGFTDELHQSIVEGRDASVLDLLSDGVGAYYAVRVIMYLGAADVSGRGLRRLLARGLTASIVAAGIATIWNLTRGEGPWWF